MTRMKTRLITGNTSQYPFNTHFTDHERQVLRMIDDLHAKAAGLKAALRELPHHACKPPENYKPDRMEEFSAIKGAIDSLERQLRWIPGGAYRFAADEADEADEAAEAAEGRIPGTDSPITRQRAGR